MNEYQILNQKAYDGVYYRSQFVASMPFYPCDYYSITDLRWYNLKNVEEDLMRKSIDWRMKS